MLNFKKFLLESQQGFAYEANVAKALAKFGWIPNGYVPAGASSDRPDLDILINGEQYGVELKMQLASAGSLVIHHLGNKEYDFGDTEGKEEKEFLKEIGNKSKVLDEIKKKWKKEPFIQKERDEKWVKRVLKAGLRLQQRYEYDLNNLKDTFFPLPSDTISKYYKIKGCDYLNVGTHGLYTLGNQDPAKFNKCNDEKIPNWNNSHTAVLRIRVQSKGTTAASALEDRAGWPSKGSQGYQLVMEIQFKNVIRSPFNIGPIRPPSPEIITNALRLPNICR
jgi:hypothetical protein